METTSERRIDGRWVPHFLDDGGYLSDGQRRSDDQKVMAWKESFSVGQSGLMHSELHAGPQRSSERREIPGSMPSDSRREGMLRIPLSADGQVEMDTDVPHRLYSWDDIRDGSSYSDGILTDRDDDDENRSPSEVHFSWPPEVADSMTVEDEQNQAFTRFRTRSPTR
jgi:hypothetical protein